MREPVVSVASLALVALILAPSPARADDNDKTHFGVGWHLDYGVGAVPGNVSGARHNLDASIFAGPITEHRGGGEGWSSSRQGPVAGLSVASGFGAYPTYAAIEGGYEWGGPFESGAVLAGPAVRIDPSAGYGFTARIEGCLLVVDAGVRVVAIPFAPTGTRELQVTFLIGAGRF